MRNEWLKKYAGVLLTAATLRDELAHYESPHDKRASLVKSGELIRLKQGCYCVSPKASGVALDQGAIANQLYGPSYLSLEMALAHYELIPEAVMGMTSVVTGRSKRYITPIGWFTYQNIPESLFGLGVRTENGHLIATPEKALCDYLYTRSNLRITSPKTLASYLEEDVRFDFDEFKDYDRSVFSAFAASGYKTGLFKAAERLFA